MRFVESNGKKEGSSVFLVCLFLQVINGLGGVLPIAIFFIGCLERFKRKPFDFLAFRVHLFVRHDRFSVSSLIFVRNGFGTPRFFRPTICVIVGVVINFANADCLIAVVFKECVERNCVWCFLIGSGGKADESSRVGSQAGHQRGPACTACRNHAV